MTTAKQIAANQRNAKKSTGAVTVEGKKRSSMNAIKHGILSGRALLPHESRKDYSCLLKALIDEFKLKGAYESFLVDKIALVMWKHKRLAIAERASIETDSDIRGYYVKKSIHQILHGHDNVLADSLHYHIIEDYKSAEADLAHWQGVLGECEKFERKAEKDIEVSHEWLKAECPTLAVWAEEDAETEEMTVDAYLRAIDLYEQVDEWSKYAKTMFHERKENINAQWAIKIVKDIYACPVTKKSDLFQRYQAGLDNELYKAVEALRRYRGL